MFLTSLSQVAIIDKGILKKKTNNIIYIQYNKTTFDIKSQKGVHVENPCRIVPILEGMNKQ